MTTTPGDEIVHRTTPGGELWHPTGTPQDEATAVASDSIHRQLGAQVEEVGALADAAMAEARRTRWTVTRDHTLIFAVEAVSDLTVNPERHTLTFKTGA